MKKLIYICLLFGGSLCAQTITPQVINAAGSTRSIGTGAASLSDNVGEPFTETLGGNPLLTQGFLQPDAIFATPVVTVTAIKTDVTCSDKNDGRITTAITSVGSSYKLTYVWTPTVTCPTKNCTSIDSLGAGQYSLTVLVSYTLPPNHPVTDTAGPIKHQVFTITDVNGPCRIKVFNGVNISGGSQDNHLVIQNIDQFPNNHLSIFNRWGQELYNQKGYDNSSKSWPSQDEQSKLLAGTYFYVLDLGDGSKPIKGWVELIK